MRFLRVTLVLLVVLVVAGVGYSAARNPETATLDVRARTNAAGQFGGLIHGVTHFDIGGPDSARTVVLVHGFSVPLYIWDSTFFALRERGYQVIRYDLYGRGLSDRPDVAYDGALFDAQLDGLLDSLHVRGPVDLIGLSFGGFVTAHYVSTHANRVRTLTLIDPVASGGPLPWFLRVPIIGPWIWQVGIVPGMADNQASDFLHPEHFPGWADKYRPQMRFPGFGRALLRTRQTMATTDFNELYASVGKTNVPVLLLWGKQDQTVPIAKATIITRNIASVEFVPIDSSGHLPHMEQATLVNDRILAFLTAHKP